MVRFNGKTLKDDIWDKAEIAEDEKSTLKVESDFCKLKSSFMRCLLSILAKN